MTTFTDTLLTPDPRWQTGLRTDTTQPTPVIRPPDKPWPANPGTEAVEDIPVFICEHCAFVVTLFGWGAAETIRRLIAEHEVACLPRENTCRQSKTLAFAATLP